MKNLRTAIINLARADVDMIGEPSFLVKAVIDTFNEESGEQPITSTDYEE